jgi:4-amino-4-deoxy-L-arabinose transferase-like glycosyltransferase
MDLKITLLLKKIFSKPWPVILAATFIFFPLIFIGTHTSHDWGDDFAQYIHQAANIVNGIPQSETGFVYSQENFIGPQTYPAGFPLILSPVYALTGNKVGAFITVVSLLYIVLGLLMIIFYRNYFSRITALVLAIIFVYNPAMVMFKREVMSDIPFTAGIKFYPVSEIKVGKHKTIYCSGIFNRIYAFGKTCRYHICCCSCNGETFLPSQTENPH